MSTYSYVKENKSREEVRETHPIIAGALKVLAEQGGPMTSVSIFRRGVEIGVFEPEQYNSVRARLSQHCDLDGARVVRAPGSKVGVRGSRTTAWVLASAQVGLQVEKSDDGMLIVRRDFSDARRRQRTRLRLVGSGRNLILTDDVLDGAPQSVRAVAGRTAREALTSAIDAEAVAWLLSRLPLEAGFRERLAAVAGSQEARSVVIEAEERRRKGRAS